MESGKTGVHGQVALYLVVMVWGQGTENAQNRNLEENIVVEKVNCWSNPFSWISLYSKNPLQTDQETENCDRLCQCSLSSWSSWTECCIQVGDHLSSISTRQRTNISTVECVNNQKLEEDKSCGNCPCHCEVSDWSDWSSCSPSCTHSVSGIHSFRI